MSRRHNKHNIINKIKWKLKTVPKLIGFILIAIAGFVLFIDSRISNGYYACTSLYGENALATLYGAQTAKFVCTWYPLAFYLMWILLIVGVYLLFFKD